MTPLDAVERSRLCDLFLELGPDAPTLCEGWTTADLAAHLVVRERDPRSGPGLLIGGRFAAYTESLRQRQKARGYEASVAKIRSGPPAFPWRIPKLRALLNLQEYFVHHEDVRRANGRGRRDDIADVENAMWAVLKRGARFSVRKVAVGVELARPGGDVVVGRTGTPMARMVGEPGEIVLFLTGRKEAAQVTFEGDPAAIEALRAAQLGV